MEYLKKSFTVAVGRSKEFRDGWGKIDWSDGKKRAPKPKKQPKKATKAAP